ncbi:hypothetical protein BaRGS_00001443 [Batillaria attramentaria]|uniref:Uncharacterized protein n=1 Tax=Batillaria attramentaria TaxID=370345 RepID=A0ABD0M7N5_9CAEN
MNVINDVQQHFSDLIAADSVPTAISFATEGVDQQQARSTRTGQANPKRSYGCRSNGLTRTVDAGRVCADNDLNSFTPPTSSAAALAAEYSYENNNIAYGHSSLVPVPLFKTAAIVALRTPTLGLPSTATSTCSPPTSILGHGPSEVHHPKENQKTATIGSTIKETGLCVLLVLPEPASEESVSSADYVWMT